MFAGRPSEFESSPLIAGALASKRTTIPVPFTSLGVRLSTLPVLAVVTPILALVWFVAGVTTVGGMITATVVGLGASSVPANASLAAIDPAVVGPPLLVGIVLVKFGFDLGGVYRERLASFDDSSALELGLGYEPPADEAIAPVEDGADRLRPTVGGRLCGGVSVTNVRQHPSAVVVGGFPVVGALLFVTGRAWDIALVLAVASLAVPLGLLTADYWLRYGGVEYRLSTDGIVAFDRLFRTRIWRLESGDDLEIRVECGWLHRWLDTSTVVVECADGKRWIPHVRDPAPIFDACDRRRVPSEEHRAVRR